MDEQKTLTLDFIKSLMEPAYTLVWTDYDDNLDNHRGLIQKCLDSKSRAFVGRGRRVVQRCRMGGCPWNHRETERGMYRL